MRPPVETASWGPQRSFAAVDEAKIAAKVEDGILTIDLPKIKREEGKTGRQIAIS